MEHSLLVGVLLAVGKDLKFDEAAVFVVIQRWILNDKARICRWHLVDLVLAVGVALPATVTLHLQLIRLYLAG